MADDKNKNGEKGQEKVEKKVEHSSIYVALSAFQGELKPIAKSAEVKFKTKAGDMVDFKYTPLEKIMETIYPLLAKHGLSVRHELAETSVECILTHDKTEDKLEMVRKVYVAGVEVEGKEAKPKTTEDHDLVTYNEIRSGKLLIDTKKSEMKDVGAQITYARRYTIGLVLGLATEEDKDVQLLAQKNVADYAFKQAKTTIEKASGKKLDEQVEFLQKELVLAEKLEAGTGKKAPSLGLKAEQYKELLKIATAKAGGVEIKPEDNQPEGDK